MDLSLLTRLCITLLGTSPAVLPLHSSFSQINDETCAKLRDFGKFYDNPDDDYELVVEELASELNKS